VIAAANVHDRAVAVETLDGGVVRAGRGVRRPRHLCLDAGYDAPYVWGAVRARGITPHIRRQRRRGEPPLLLGPMHQGKPRRWVVERTGSWYNRFRGLLIRWERKATNYEANVHLASALIALQQAR
jgi:transposase